jgi:hypothetical protein
MLQTILRTTGFEVHAIGKSYGTHVQMDTL